MANLPVLSVTDELFTKTCKGCKQNLPKECFRYADKEKKYLYSYCKKCGYSLRLKDYHKRFKNTPVPNLEGEVWKDVVGYERLYSVSNFGRIKRNFVSVPHGSSGYIKRKEGLLTQNLNRHGYRKVILSKENNKKVIVVHLVVWDAFGDIKRNGGIMVVDHKDNDRQNNNISNLQCITQRLNYSKDRQRKHSKYLGVYKHSNKKKKWEAKIMINGKSKRLGLFYTEEDASEAYQTALKQVI